MVVPLVERAVLSVMLRSCALRDEKSRALLLFVVNALEMDHDGVMPTNAPATATNELKGEREPASVPRTARERARLEVTAEIKRVARDQLAASGA